MSSVNSSETTEKRAWWQKLNRALFPFMGPAQLGPFDQEPLPPTAQKPCPLCGQAMELHTFVRSQDRASTRMTCP